MADEADYYSWGSEGWCESRMGAHRKPLSATTAVKRSALFANWITYDLSGVFWLFMNKGRYLENRHRILLTVLDTIIFCFGAVIVGLLDLFSIRWSMLLLNKHWANMVYSADSGCILLVLGSIRMHWAATKHRPALIKGKIVVNRIHIPQHNVLCRALWRQFLASLSYFRIYRQSISMYKHVGGFSHKKLWRPWFRMPSDLSPNSVDYVRRLWSSPGKSFSFVRQGRLGQYDCQLTSQLLPLRPDSYSRNLRDWEE